MLIQPHSGKKIRSTSCRCASRNATLRCSPTRRWGVSYADALRLDMSAHRSCKVHWARIQPLFRLARMARIQRCVRVKAWTPHFVLRITLLVDCIFDGWGTIAGFAVEPSSPREGNSLFTIPVFCAVGCSKSTCTCHCLSTTPHVPLSLSHPLRSTSTASRVDAQNSQSPNSYLYVPT